MARFIRAAMFINSMIPVGMGHIGRGFQRPSGGSAGGYTLHGFKCCDAVFNVIRAYDNGNDRTLPWPAVYWAPRWWYAAIPGPSIFMQSQAATGNWLSQHGG